MTEEAREQTHFPRITHIALHVEDLEATVAFYERYCGMRVSHSRDGGHIVWMAEPGREKDFILVIMAGGQNLQLAGNDYRHLGFAVADKADVDRIADLARARGDLVWEPREEDYPVGYYCGLKDPNGNYIEFSYGQPLGPGS